MSTLNSASVINVSKPFGKVAQWPPNESWFFPLPFSWHISGPLKDKRLKTDWNQVWEWYLCCTWFLPSLLSLFWHFHQWLGLKTCLSNLLIVMWFWPCIIHLESRSICTVWNDGFVISQIHFQRNNIHYSLSELHYTALRVYTKVKNMTCCQVIYKEDVRVLWDCNSVPISSKMWLTEQLLLFLVLLMEI